jgi:hypothetical protein
LTKDKVQQLSRLTRDRVPDLFWGLQPAPVFDRVGAALQQSLPLPSVE